MEISSLLLALRLSKQVEKSRECGEDDFTLYLVNESGFDTLTLDQILPYSFSAKKHMGWFQDAVVHIEQISPKDDVYFVRISEIKNYVMSEYPGKDENYLDALIEEYYNSLDLE